MTHTRTDRIPLAHTEPRCEPFNPCAMFSRCARYIAAIPRGAPITDYSTGTAGGTALCQGYLAAAGVRRAEAVAVAPKRHWSEG